MKYNPIAFNPDTMTVSQLKFCAETLRSAFDQIDRGANEDTIVYYLGQARNQMLKQWGS